MSRIRLLAVIAGALLTLAFASSALASGGGTPGNDAVPGGARAAHIALGAGDDNARGGRGNDVLDGGRGDDRLNGGLGDDRLRGGGGDDVLTDNRGTDRFSGGTGDDRINPRDRRGRDARRDVVDCGAGDDPAPVDRDDAGRPRQPAARAG